MWPGMGIDLAAVIVSHAGAHITASATPMAFDTSLWVRCVARSCDGSISLSIAVTCQPHHASAVPTGALTPLKASTAEGLDASTGVVCVRLVSSRSVAACSASAGPHQRGTPLFVHSWAGCGPPQTRPLFMTPPQTCLPWLQLCPFLAAEHCPF